MKSEIQIKNSAGVCRIEIEGTIGVPEEWQFDQPEARVATYEKFRDTVQRIAGIDAPQIVVDIRSTGGDVNDALLIHDALCSLDAHIITRCYGYTASAATIIAQAASPGCREISANALYLIHTAICAAEGNAAEIAGKLDLLRQTDTRIAAVYAARSGRPAGEFEALMAEIQANIYRKALAYRDSMITRVDTWEEFKRVLDEKGGFVSAHWDGTAETEVAIKEATKATIRCIPVDAVDEEGVCVFSGRPSHRRVLFARSY